MYCLECVLFLFLVYDTTKSLINLSYCLAFKCSNRSDRPTREKMNHIENFYKLWNLLGNFNRSYQFTLRFKKSLFTPFSICILDILLVSLYKRNIIKQEFQSLKESFVSQKILFNFVKWRLTRSLNIEDNLYVEN